jgi:spore germination cell wall hydrolase CwlJ-like protein
MLNKHTVQRFTIVAVLISIFLFGATILHEVQAQARAQQLLQSQREAEQLRREVALKEQRRIREAKLKREITCLARNIYFESRGEPYLGKIAVAQVTINRVNSSKFPASVCDVVHQKTNYNGITVCQFSWVCEGANKIRAPHLYDESLRIARRVMIDGYRLPELKGAKFFHADYVDPGWDRPVKAKIGRHIFY